MGTYDEATMPLTTNVLLPSRERTPRWNGPDVGTMMAVAVVAVVVVSTSGG
jgi:hypothetical protein